MINLVLITSIVDPPQTPFSYINTRSIYSKIERFEQTKKTIESVKDKIVNCKIIIVECSQLSDEETDYFIRNTDYFLNIYSDEYAKNNVYSASKSLGEGTMTLYALNYIQENNINYDSLFKISGRYWLSDNFIYENFNNNCVVLKSIDNNLENVFTALYKLPKETVSYLLLFLRESFHDMAGCIGYELLIGKFILTLREQNKKNIIVLKNIGLDGLVSVSNEFYSG
jgi:hypothetical protein